MNRFRKLIKTRLQGSSLVEVMISLSIASIIFVIGTALWLSLNGTNAPKRLLEYRLNAGNLLLETELEGDVSEQTYQIGGAKYFKSTRELNRSHGIYEVVIVVQSAEGKEVFKRGRIIQIEAN